MRYGDRKKPEKQRPGKLQIVLDLLRTAEGERDTLGDADALRDWLVEKELLPASGAVSEDDHREALAVRAGFHALALGNSGEPVDGNALRALNDTLDNTVYRIRFKAKGSSRTPAGDGWALVKARLAELVHTAIEEGKWKRVKVCPGCGRHFYDVAINLSGKWCPGKRCSSRATSETFRRRHPRVHGQHVAPFRRGVPIEEELQRYMDSRPRPRREGEE